MRLGVVMAVATVYTVLFAVIVLYVVLMAGPFFGPPPDRLAQLGPGTALLAIGWTWLLYIRRGARRRY